MTQTLGRPGKNHMTDADSSSKPTRVTVDATQIIGVPMSAIIHDLGPDEVVCPKCQGVGMYKTVYKSPDRMFYDQQWNPCVPWHNQYLVQCEACSVGKATRCKHCLTVSRNAFLCDCHDARFHRELLEEARETTRRLSCRHIALEDYQGEYVYYADDASYVPIDDIEYYLSMSYDPDNAVFFACALTSVEVMPTADDIMLRIADEAHLDDDEGVEFSDTAADALTALLATWTKQHCTFTKQYTQDAGLIVDVPAAWRLPTSEE